MLRGIACKLKQEDLKAMLDGMGLRGMFSSVYVPCTIVQRSNLGYAFVRFRHVEYARQCHRLCHGRPMGCASPDKVCEVVPARRQGRGAFAAKRHGRKGDERGALVCDDPIELCVAHVSETALLERALRHSSGAGLVGQGLSPSASRPTRPPFSAECSASSCGIFEDGEVQTFPDDTVDALRNDGCGNYHTKF